MSSHRQSSRTLPTHTAQRLPDDGTAETMPRRPLEPAAERSDQRIAYQDNNVSTYTLHQCPHPVQYRATQSRPETPSPPPSYESLYPDRPEPLTSYRDAANASRHTTDAQPATTAHSSLAMSTEYSLPYIIFSMIIFTPLIGGFI